MLFLLVFQNVISSILFVAAFVMQSYDRLMSSYAATIGGTCGLCMHQTMVAYVGYAKLISIVIL